MSAGQWREVNRAWKRLGAWLDDKVTGPGSRDREPDPLAALGDVGQVRRLLDEVELRAVRSARLRGRSWAEIATRLGVTRQSAWERWRDLDETDEPPVPAGEPITRRVTVPNVVGMPVLGARRELVSRGLVPVGNGIDDASAELAIVTDQSPESGAVVPPGTGVRLWIDRGEGGVRAPLRTAPDPLPMAKYLPEPSEESEAVG